MNPTNLVTTPAEARAIAEEAYIYLYPLVLMDITRRVAINNEPGQLFGHGPMQTFCHARVYPDASFRDVVRPNFDTLYSSAWVDLTQEPVIVSAPDTQGRYYLLPMLDMWTDAFAAFASVTRTMMQRGCSPIDGLVAIFQGAPLPP